MSTIGKHAGRTTRGKYPALCAYCGAHWPRNQLRRDASGKLYCPDEGKGLDAAALDRITADNAKRAGVRRRPSRIDGATIEGAGPTDPTLADHPVPGTTGAALLDGVNLSADFAHLYRGTDVEHA